jgi:two-component system response regulator FlrC
VSPATVLVVEDDAALREALALTLGTVGYRTVAAGDGLEALTRFEREPIDLVVADVQMQPMDGHTLLKRIKAQRPLTPVLLMTAYGSIPSAVAAMHDGAADYLAKPFDAEVLVSLVGRHLPAAATNEELVANDPRMRELVAIARRVAESDATVLVSGESGTGKEVLARYIHRASPRRDRPFVAINCAAIPDNMLEATLFGYEKGAFTGAIQACPGKFEQAQGGTLLLDEISEMSLPLQAKLLRVLQEREVERLGGRKLIALDVRVLATTNRTLRAEVAAGRFREDLFYRLHVFPLALPPLRARRDDIAPIAEKLLAQAAAAHGRRAPRLSAAARACLLAHDWPGNVRELDNLMQRVCILQAGETIEATDLGFEAATVSAPEATPETGDDLGSDLKAHEQRLILDALREGGSRKAAAEKLGISARTLRYKLARMREAGIEI